MTSCRDAAGCAEAERARTAAEAELSWAREAYEDEASGIFVSGARVAERDCDRLVDIALRLVQTLDDLEPAFDRLDIARDVAGYAGPLGRRFERSMWDRQRLALLLAESFQHLLRDNAYRVLSAAARLETCP